MSTHVYKNYCEELYIESTVKMAAYLISFLEVGAQSNGNQIFTKGYNLNVGPACIALYEIFVFAAAIVAYPMKIKDKIEGVVLGIIAIGALNLLRIVMMFFAGIYFPTIFKTLHDHVFQTVFILFMVVLWCYWIGKSNKAEPAE